jgi:hypothetical protein
MEVSSIIRAQQSLKENFTFSTARGGRILIKKALIVVALVKESGEKKDAELEREILEELSKAPHVIPWMKKVLKVEVVEEP